ncbi:MAG: hypothetical protein M3Z04_09730 [Chloroflexota bacterium]|nr:hypothetical protein [Chloroflexota bacterium]
MSSIPNLPQLVQTVATARVATTQAQTTLATARSAWEQANADLLQAVSAARSAQASAEERLRVATLAAYAATGSKRPHPALGVRLTTRLEYDRAQVTAWAQRHMPAVLTLDIARFEAVARQLAVPEVTVVHEPTATIRTDLTAWTRATT